MADTLTVPFAGEGSGVAGLTWGQQVVWRSFEAMGRPVWLTRTRAVPAGTTVEDLADQVAYQLSRHQSLRTRLIVTGDAPVQQVVAESGELALSIADAGDDDDPYQVASAIEEDWSERDFGYDYAADWPVRFAIVVHRGVPVYLVRGFSHIVADGFALMKVQEDLAARDPVTGAPPGPVTAMQPLEEARWQASPAGRRRSQMAEQYWERLLRTIPARRFPEREDTPPPAGTAPAGTAPAGTAPAGTAQAGCCRVYFDSRAAYLAIQAIAARTQLATPHVLLAAFTVGLARATGVNPLVPRAYVSNRFRPRLAGAVSPLVQTCPCAIDVAGTTFDEAVRRTYYASLSAYKHAYFEPVRIRELVAAVSAERGEPVDVDLVYNDIRLYSPRGVPACPPGPGDIAAARPLTTLTCEDRPGPEDPCHFTFEDTDAVRDHGAPPTINVTVQVDDHYLPRSRVQESLRELEDVLIRAAFDPDVPTGV